MEKEYISALIGVCGTLLGFILSEISNSIKRKSDEKERLLLANFTLRQQGYAQIYSALTKYEKYFYHFVDYGNEFDKHKNPIG